MSKRQDTLFRRMKSEQKKYLKVRNELNTMLLNTLHKNGVYTPDQFNNSYVTRKQANEYVKKELSRYNQPLTSQSQDSDNQ